MSSTIMPKNFNAIHILQIYLYSCHSVNNTLYLRCYHFAVSFHFDDTYTILAVFPDEFVCMWTWHLLIGYQ